MSCTADQFVNQMASWVGYSEANGKYKKIIDLYNSHKPLARGYKLKYTDEWCDGTISACAIACNAVDIIGTEVGCEQHVKIFKRLGIWIEDGRITPRKGDIILFNWDDNSQPNDGYSDHIGVVEKVSGNTITTIEGNKSSAVGRRTLKVGAGNIRGYARPKYKAESSGGSTTNLTAVAKDVIAGKYGNGDVRKKALQAKGYDYNAVQAEVNRILKGTASSYDVTAVARDVIAGKYGNGEARKKALQAKGYDYTAVQKKVNELLK